MAPELSGGCQQNYSMKTRQAGRANEQSKYSLMSMVPATCALVEVAFFTNKYTLCNLFFLDIYG